MVSEDVPVEPVHRFAVDGFQRYTRSMILSVIAAVSENNVIGKGNDLAWKLPAELAYFRSVTKGKPVIMGRKTAESIMKFRNGQLLPGRHNIVISRQGITAPEADVVSSIDDAISLAKADGAEEVFVIGGGQIYEASLPLADRLYLTRVHTVIDEGDTFFPAFDEKVWKMLSSEKHEIDSENSIPFTKMVYERMR